MPDGLNSRRWRLSSRPALAEMGYVHKFQCAAYCSFKMLFAGSLVAVGRCDTETAILVNFINIILSSL